MRFNVLVGGVCAPLLLGLSTISMAQPRDIEGAHDHPLVSRFPGAEIIRYHSGEYDELLVQLAEATGIGEFAESQRVTGKVTRITYEIPAGHSTLEVLQSYRQALAEAGFETLFSCAMDRCGPHLFFQHLERPFIIDKNHRYLAATKERPEDTVFVTARVYTTARADPPVRAMINIAEVRELEEGLIEVDAKAMAQSIKDTGHVAIYGVYFDTDKAVIKPGSEAALEEMAKLLDVSPELKVYIVGHTDTTGALAHNMELSQRRAKAVEDALVSTYGVNPARLMAKGVGPFSPVASNVTETGRAKNRRVELVEQHR